MPICKCRVRLCPDFFAITGMGPITCPTNFKRDGILNHIGKWGALQTQSCFKMRQTNGPCNGICRKFGAITIFLINFQPLLWFCFLPYYSWTFRFSFPPLFAHERKSVFTIIHVKIVIERGSSRITSLFFTNLWQHFALICTFTK